MVLIQSPHAFCALLVIGVLGGCGASDTPPAPAKFASQEATQPATPTTRISPEQKKYLTIAVVGEDKAGDTVLLPARVSFRPQAQSAIGAPVSGRVVAQLARAGEIVKAGAPLLVIESADAAATRAIADQSATRLTAAEQNYRRQQEMVAKGVGLEAERQEAEARLNEARAERRRSQQALALIGGSGSSGSRVTVAAPVAGVVLQIRAAVGAVVAPGGEALLELGDPSRLQIVAQAAEGDLRRIAVGQTAEITVPALNSVSKARVESISPRIDPEARRAPVYLSTDTPIAHLQPGMLAQIALTVSRDAVVTVPNSAVLIRHGKERVVYVEKADGGFEARTVRTGAFRDGQVVILEGLKSGERIVTKGALLIDTQAELLL
jgi:cobalt-zinc-cadmium efflux system membrane fusion protein